MTLVYVHDDLTFAVGMNICQLGLLSEDNHSILSFTHTTFVNVNVGKG
jgi:hypothetical protein